MAFNLQAFKTRALTAIVFVVVMLVGLLWNGDTFFYLLVIIHFGCWYEFIKLLRKINKKIFGYLIPFGLLYITLPCLLIHDLGYPNISNWLNQKGYEDSLGYSPLLPCLIIFSIWINDTMAYIVGSLIGKTPFSKISAKKTWEGTIGGAVLCIAVIALLGYWTQIYTVKDGIFIAAICAFFGTLGDLLESKLKRLSRVKDSGTIMPGHGGFLDRFDSLLIATPFVWLYVYFFMR